ncbi:hypothetical protein [Dyadobacter aurulentus]|uniref:hypothetical protein n=1 Tax=Dyadobacter sp. UC 10 TaxID=2605428 RepID=UPI0011F132DD|nr:hypothetical protein [Dyadobacter sp. UC 10]KAA0992837.1 hypothetical protein FXO21_23005 [Dyadobacter sp. UC 10]
MNRRLVRKTLPAHTFQYSVLAALGCMLFLFGCNSVVEPNEPPVLSEIPEKVVKMFSTRFPNATETTIRIVEKDRLWEVNYKVDDQRFYAGMDSNRILRRSRLIAGSIPDSVQQYVNAAPATGVMISNYQEEVESFHRNYNMYTARYRSQDKEYLMGWVAGSRSYMIRSEPFYKFEYPINSRADLPANILAVIDSEQFIHVGGLVFINEKNERRYQVSASNGDGMPGGDYVFDKDGNLISTNYKPAKTFASANEVPESVRQYLDRLNAQGGFTFQLGYQMRINNGYWIYLSNSNRQTLEVILDQNAKELETVHTKYID